jgi:uncharacterized protein YbjT (DUF2867 family)
MPSDQPRIRIVLAGASGLVGGQCLRRALESPAIAGVVAVSRRALPIVHPKLEVTLVEDFARLADGAAPPASAALCALGTTIKRAGSQPAFRAVDHDAVVAFARWALRAGCRTFVVVSSVGADHRSGTFYLRVKGETEQALATLGFERLVVLRPSLILGARADRRLGEALAMKALPAIGPLLAGRFRRYRAISADTVAAAMLTAAAAAPPGFSVWEHDEIVAHAQASA